MPNAKKKYSHLSAHERDLVAVWRGQGLSLRLIAKRLRRHASTLSRELCRNSAPRYKSCYLPHRAQARAATRFRESHRRLRLKNRKIRAYVERKLRLRWSPEIIAGRISREFPGYRIGYEAIYRWLYAEARHLIPFLPRRHRKRMKRGYVRGRHRKLHIPGRVPILKRPRAVETRRQAGHWEIDTAVSRQSLAALLVCLERKSRFTKLFKLPRKTARNLSIAVNRSLSHYPPALRRTFTYDNGSENTDHLRINRVLGSSSFFCAPYHSWEKGSVENVIGLVRRYFPKKTNFARLSSRKIRWVESALNSRPKKCLGFRTPRELFTPLKKRLRA